MNEEITPAVSRDYEVEEEMFYGDRVRCLFPDGINTCGCTVVRYTDMETLTASIYYHPESSRDEGWGPPCQVFPLTPKEERKYAYCINGHSALFEAIYREHLRYWHSAEWESAIEIMRAAKVEREIREAHAEYQKYIADQQRGTARVITLYPGVGYFPAQSGGEEKYGYGLSTGTYKLSGSSIFGVTVSSGT